MNFVLQPWQLFLLIIASWSNREQQLLSSGHVQLLCMANPSGLVWDLLRTRLVSSQFCTRIPEHSIDLDRNLCLMKQNDLAIRRLNCSFQFLDHKGFQ